MTIVEAENAGSAKRILGVEGNPESEGAGDVTGQYDILIDPPPGTDQPSRSAAVEDLDKTLPQEDETTEVNDNSDLAINSLPDPTTPVTCCGRTVPISRKQLQFIILPVAYLIAGLCIGALAQIVWPTD